MSTVFEWFWSGLQAISQNISNFFSSIGDVVQQITNTGQGIFNGLVAFASAIWEGIIKFGESIYKGLEWVGKQFYDALKSFGEWVYNGLVNAYNFIAQGFSYIGSALYSFGNWVYNGILWLGRQLLNILQNIFNWVIDRVVDFIGMIKTWWDTVARAFNTWLSNLIVDVRRKIKQMIVANVTLYFSWKALNRIERLESLRDIGKVFLGVALSPLAGYLLGSIVESFVPTPSTYYRFIPEFGEVTVERRYITIPEAMEPVKPETPSIPYLSYLFRGAYEKNLEIGLEGIPNVWYPIRGYSSDEIGLEGTPTGFSPKGVENEVSLEYEYTRILPIYLGIGLESEHEISTSTSRNLGLELESKISLDVPLEREVGLEYERTVIYESEKEIGISLEFESSTYFGGEVSLGLSLESSYSVSAIENGILLEYTSRVILPVSSETELSSYSSVSSESILQVKDILGASSVSSEAIKETPSITSGLGASSEAIKVTPSITSSFVGEKRGLQHEIGLEYIYSQSRIQELALGLESSYQTSITESAIGLESEHSVT